MWRSEYRELADQVFGAASAASLGRDLVLGACGDRTAEQALADGQEPRDVWVALCDAMDVPEERRWGARPGERRAG